VEQGMAGESDNGVPQRQDGNAQKFADDQTGENIIRRSADRFGRLHFGVSNNAGGSEKIFYRSLEESEIRSEDGDTVVESPRRLADFVGRDSRLLRVEKAGI